jgi:uncharacterized lipoprotein YajG
MKRLALVAAVLVLAACAKKDESAVADTSVPAMAPAPAVVDTTGVKVDTTASTTTTTTTTKKK